MVILLIILRIIHIFSGMFWVGFAFVNLGFLQPTMRATAPEGQKFMQHLTQRTRLLTTIYTAATLTLLSGLIMYWILTGFRMSVLASGYGLTLTIGSVAGLVAWIVAIVVIRDIFNQMGSIGQAIQAQGGPPTAEQAAALQALGARLGSVGNVALVFLVIALLGMSAAQYMPS